MKTLGIDKVEAGIFKKLNSPRKLQDFLNALPMNFEAQGDTCNSPRITLREQTAHCFEGALLAAAVLWYHNEQPILLDLRTNPQDFDHVVALFKRHGHWGAFSKTNHAVLRYREPVYRTVRELAMSYFHEYYLDNGSKSLRSFSEPFVLPRDPYWITTEDDLSDLAVALDDSPHENILTPAMRASLRRVDPIELKAGSHIEWKPPTRRASELS